MLSEQWDGGGDFAQEIRITGMVHHVDANAFPIHVGEFHANGLFALDFFFEVIADGVSVLHAA